jgi:hypothetical protein
MTRIKLMFAVSGDLINHIELTNLTHVVPSIEWKSGDEILPQKRLIRKDDTPRYRKESSWIYSTGFIGTLDFEDISKLFENAFKNKTKILGQYIQRNNLDANINIVIEIVNKEKPSIQLNKNFIQIADDLKAEVDIDMYLFDNN